LLLSPRLVGNLALLLFIIVLNALSHIELQLAAFMSWEIIELELKDIVSSLIDHITDNINDASLLLRGQLANKVLQVVLLLLGHALIVDRSIKSLPYKAVDLISLSPILSIVCHLTRGGNLVRSSRLFLLTLLRNGFGIGLSQILEVLHGNLGSPRLRFDLLEILCSPVSFLLQVRLVLSLTCRCRATSIRRRRLRKNLGVVRNNRSSVKATLWHLDQTFVLKF
jgi:hypothetical protein